MVALSALVITLNEESRLAKCLASLPPGVEIVVVDSGSQDRTVEIAESFGAVVIRRRFDNYSNQRNEGLRNATGDWILSIDADEVCNAELTQFLSDVCLKGKTQKEFAAYRVPRRLVFMGKTLRFGKCSDEPVRFFKRGSGKFEGTVHEKYSLVQEGRLGRLPGFLWHFSYHDLSDYFQKFNLYTSAVAQQHHAGKESKPAFVRHLVRPFSEFIVRYFFRLGFLDGYPGYCYALVSSMYAFVKYAKWHEIIAKEGQELGEN